MGAVLAKKVFADEVKMKCDASIVQFDKLAYCFDFCLEGRVVTLPGVLVNLERDKRY